MPQAGVIGECEGAGVIGECEGADAIIHLPFMLLPGNLNRHKGAGSLPERRLGLLYSEVNGEPLGRGGNCQSVDPVGTVFMRPCISVADIHL